MNFTFHQLKILCTVAETSSVTKPADKLHMTQPAVSIQLKKLQDQFKMPLTEVIGRKLHLTDFGKHLASIAEKIMEEAEEISYHTERFQGNLSGKLKIAVVSTGKYVMPYFLKDFLNIHPGIDLQMDVTNKSRVIESLEKNEVDFALVSIVPKNLNIEEIILMPDRLFLAAGQNNEIEKGNSAKHFFNQLPLIYREEGSATRQKMQLYFEKKHINPRVKLELTSAEAVKQAVMAGLGYSILSLLSLKSELLQDEIRIIPVTGLPLKSEWRLIWLSAKKLSVAAKTYLQFIRENKSSIYNDHFKWIEAYH